MATSLSLEGDGLIENLFHFLWSKDDFNAGPRVFVPHTVVYKAAQPSAWYFTSLKTGKIKKKNKTNLTNLQIEHAFTKRSRQLQGTDIVACYLYQIPTDGRNGQDNDDDDASPPLTTIIEYLDATTLHAFLFSRDKIHNGLLQRFVLPKGTHNATVRAIWSPKICLLERRVNTKSLYDPRFSVYERGVTFDGGGAGELFSRPEPVRGAMLPGEVQRLCEQVVDHVTRVSYHKVRIARMVLHLKSDADDRLWLLWCSSLRLLRVNASDAVEMRPLDIVSDAQVPAHVSLGHVGHASPPRPRLRASQSQPSFGRVRVVDFDRDAPLRDGFQRCTSCARVVEQPRLLTTTYKAVLEHFHRFLLFLRLQLNEKEQVAIEWPPHARFIEAAGGVGFGILRFCEKILPAVPPSGGGGKGLHAKELFIPPVIQYLHPTLGVEDFERHRHDPIFLHKPVAVCEACCLVYSDYTTTALEVNSLGPNVPAILRPQREITELKRRLDPIDPVAVAVASPHKKVQSQGRAKPPASAWKPIPRNTKPNGTAATSLTQSKSTLHALPPAPRLPDRIESLAEFMGSVVSGSSDGADSALQHEREETFFRELYHQQGVAVDDSGYPLHHMLESADHLTQLSTSKKKQLAAIRKGVQVIDRDDRTMAQTDWRAMGTSASMSALDKVLSKKPSKNPYTIVQKLSEKNQLSLLPQTGKKKKPTTHKTTHYKESSQYEWLQEEEEEDDEEDRDALDSLSASNVPQIGSNSNNNSKSPVARRYVSTREVHASEAHQAFLFAALHDAQQQRHGVGALASFVLPFSAREKQVNVQPETSDELRSVLSENASLLLTTGNTQGFAVDT